MSRSVDYVTLAVDVWLFMVLPTVYALTKSVLPISQGAPLLAMVGRKRPVVPHGRACPAVSASYPSLSRPPYCPAHGTYSV